MVFRLIKKYIHLFLTSPQQLFVFFIGMNLVPSILLLFTEPYSFLGKIVLLTFPTGVYLILFAFSKKIGRTQLILIPVLILHAFQLVLFYLFGESVIAVDMFLNLATTNVTEASELLDNLWPAIILVCVLYLPTIFIAAVSCAKKSFLSSSFRKRMLISGVILIMLSFGLSFLSKNKNTDTFSIDQEVYPANVIYNLYYAIHKWQRGDDYPVSSRDFTFNAHKGCKPEKREIYILVVGEASRANNWSLCGYGRETNPQLAQTPGIVFYKDAITQANATHKSVPLIMSAASAENYEVIYKQKSILEAFKEVGFKTIFLSNQTPNRSFTDFFAAEADFHHNIRPASAGGIYTVNNLDEAMLPLLQHYIDSLPDNLFFVLHTYGSHFNYKERYPEEFSKFKPDNATNVEVKNKDQLVNAYDNSILYTDDYLHNLIGILQGSDVCAALFYTPDHGEDLLDDSRNRFLHASPNPTYYQLHIPMFMWFSGNYQLSYPRKVEAAISNITKPVATDAVFHTLLDVAAIRTEYLQPGLSLVDPEFKVARRMYLNDHDKPIFFYKAGLKKQDKEMIEKKGMHH